MEVDEKVLRGLLIDELAKRFFSEDAGELEEGVARGLVRTVLRGGMDTTISGIASMVKIMSERPEFWAKLRQDRSKLKLVFDEVIRLETPIQCWYRTTTRDLTLGGMKLEADKKIQVFAGSANRDPRRWERPDEFDIGRAAAGHLAFGQGIHICIGQLIARMEAESVLNAMLDRIERIEPTGVPTYRPLNTMRTLETLPLRLVPA